MRTRLDEEMGRIVEAVLVEVNIKNVEKRA